MNRVNALLLLAVIASSLLLIRSAYDARRLFDEIHKSEVEALRLDGEAKRLEAERQAQATSLRVERTAREKLSMRTVTPAVTTYVVDPAASGAAPGRGVPASGPLVALSSSGPAASSPPRSTSAVTPRASPP